MYFPNEKQSKEIQKHLLNFSNLLKKNQNPKFYEIPVSEFFGKGYEGGVFIVQKDDGFWWYSRFRNPEKGIKLRMKDIRTPSLRKITATRIFNIMGNIVDEHLNRHLNREVV